MVEMPTTPKRGCVRLSYVWLCCNYVEHREDSHHMCADAWNCICVNMHDHLVDNLSLAICLGVEGCVFGELGVHPLLEARLKCVEEPIVPI